MFLGHLAYLAGKPGGDKSMVRREGASPYPLLSREELGGIFLGLMPNLAPKG